MKINYKIQTNKSFEQAIIDLKENLKASNFGVLWELNLKDKLIEKGQDFDRNFQVLEVCNPKKAKEVLDINIEVGYFLPCKMVVYEDNGSVFIGMPKPTELIGLFGDTNLTKLALEVETELKNAIDSSK